MVPAQHPSVHAQLSTPVFSLAAAGQGSHTITVRIAPEDLGPVTVRAHVTPDGMRIELFSATEMGREAVRAALPDLRREATAVGLGASLDLGGRTPEDAGDSPERAPAAYAETLPEDKPQPLEPHWSSPSTVRLDGSRTLDLLA